MRTPSNTVSAFLALMLLVSPAMAIVGEMRPGNSCSFNHSYLFLRRWLITITKMEDDILYYCGRFWKNMKNPNFASACLVSVTHCDQNTNGDMSIEFHVPLWCNGGHIESAWWEATHHKYGAIDCSS